MSGLTIRPMALDELKLHLSWAAIEGWNPGLYDAIAFHAQDPGGFFLGEINGEAVGMVSGVRYGEAGGFIGLYIVRQPYRGRGLGMQLWQRAMAHLSGRSIGLDGVSERQDDYARSGFQLAWRHVRYQGKTPVTDGFRHPHLHPLGHWPAQQLLAFDRRHFGWARESFLTAWLNQPGTLSVGLGPAHDLQAYGVVRPCAQGYKVGPLFASNPQQARAVLLSLLSQLPAGSQVQVDVPAQHADAIELLGWLRFTPVFQTARMYLGARPSMPMDHLYGCTSLELG